MSYLSCVTLSPILCVTLLSLNCSCFLFTSRSSFPAYLPLSSCYLIPIFYLSLRLSPPSFYGNTFSARHSTCLSHSHPLTMSISKSRNIRQVSNLNTHWAVVILDVITPVFIRLRKIVYVLLYTTSEVSCCYRRSCSQRALIFSPFCITHYVILINTFTLKKNIEKHPEDIRAFRSLSSSDNV